MFRQTYNGITVQAFKNEGFSIFNYQVPVLGPPWQIPHEFPIYHLSAYAIVKSGIFNIDVACRLTNIIYFYISAFFLYLICILFLKKDVSIIVLLYYLWAPYMVFWSRTAMMDYSSVAFALGYFYFFIKWLRDSNRLIYFVVALVSGTFGYLSKPTTMLTVDILLAYFILKSLFIDVKHSSKSCEDESLSQFFANRKAYFGFLFVLIIFPVCVEYLWVLHSDNVKSLSDTTAWLTSDNLKTWHIGTLQDKLNIEKWRAIAGTFYHMFLPGFTIIVLFLGLLPLKENKDKLELGYLSLFATLATIFTFFNVYWVHDYYLMGVSPFLSIPIGIGIFFLLSKLKLLKYPAIAIVAGVALICFALYHSKYHAYFSLKRITSPVISIGEYINSISSKDEFVVVTDHDWSPQFLYYADRKGLMLQNPKWETHSMLKKYNFTVIAGLKERPKLLNNWKYHRLMNTIDSVKIYKVSDELEDLEVAPPDSG